MTKPKWLTDPADLSEAALSYWHYYAPGLHRAGTLTADNAEAFKGLCRLLATARAAEAEIARRGVTIETASGSRKANPACGVLFDAQRQAAPLLRAFGLD